MRMWSSLADSRSRIPFAFQKKNHSTALRNTTRMKDVRSINYENVNIHLFSKSFCNSFPTTSSADRGGPPCMNESHLIILAHNSKYNRMFSSQPPIFRTFSLNTDFKVHLWGDKSSTILLPLFSTNSKFRNHLALLIFPTRLFRQKKNVACKNAHNQPDFTSLVTQWFPEQILYYAN